MEGEFTKEQIDEFKEAFTVFDKGHPYITSV